MARTEPSVLVIGGTRGTGAIIAQLLQQRGFAVRVLARTPARARALFGSSVELIAGDITKPETLPAAVEGASDVIFTAGIHSGHPARESSIKTTEYDGVRNTLVAARQAGLAGRFMYMTASGVNAHSFATFALNLYKGNTLVWRLRAEDEIRGSGLDYTIIRAAVLVNAAANRRAIVVTQQPRPLSLFHRIARGDVAEAFVAAVRHPRASRATFDVEWGKGPRREPWPALLDQLEPDAISLGRARPPAS